MPRYGSPPRGDNRSPPRGQSRSPPRGYSPTVRRTPRYDDRRGDRRDYRRSPPRRYPGGRAERNSPHYRGRDHSPSDNYYGRQRRSPSPDMTDGVGYDLPPPGEDDVPPPVPLTVRTAAGTERPIGMQPFDPETNCKYQQATRWQCRTCGFTNYNVQQCESCGAERRADEDDHIPAHPVDVPLRRTMVTNELCLSRLPRSIQAEEIRSGIESILREFPTIDLAEALRGMKIELSSGIEFPSALAIVTFKDPPPAARVHESIKKAGMRFLGAKMRVEFSRRSILKLLHPSDPRRAGRVVNERRADGASKDQHPDAVTTPPAPKPFEAPSWETTEQLKHILEDIDARWNESSNEAKAFYNTHLHKIAPRTDNNSAVEHPVMAEVPPPPATGTATAVPVPPSAESELLQVQTKALSFAERLAQVKAQKAAQAALSAVNPPAVSSQSPTTEVSPGGLPGVSSTPKPRPAGYVNNLGEWPRYNIIAEKCVTGRFVVRATSLTAPVAVHPSFDEPFVLCFPRAAVDHVHTRLSSPADWTAENKLGYASFVDKALASDATATSAL